MPTDSLPIDNLPIDGMRTDSAIAGARMKSAEVAAVAAVCFSLFACCRTPS
jgi:hypothetical protein